MMTRRERNEVLDGRYVRHHFPDVNKTFWGVVKYLGWEVQKATDLCFNIRFDDGDDKQVTYRELMEVIMPEGTAWPEDFEKPSYDVPTPPEPLPHIPDPDVEPEPVAPTSAPAGPSHGTARTRAPPATPARQRIPQPAATTRAPPTHQHGTRARARAVSFAPPEQTSPVRSRRTSGPPPDGLVVRRALFSSPRTELD